MKPNEYETARKELAHYFDAREDRAASGGDKPRLTALAVRSMVAFHALAQCKETADRYYTRRPVAPRVHRRAALAMVEVFEALGLSWEQREDGKTV